MKVYVTEYGKRSDDEPVFELKSGQFVRVVQDDGQVVELMAKKGATILRSPEGVLVFWPESSNQVAVEALDHMERPGFVGRALGTSQARLTSYLKVSLGNLVDGIEKLRFAVDKGAGKDHPYIEQLDQYLKAAKAGLAEFE